MWFYAKILLSRNLHNIQTFQGRWVQVKNGLLTFG